ncbi:DUF4276 family protein [Nocardiopsis sp. N85]|uniref:DUF4276 family protein n=1 Tax=Nocardiopsis sp. N85 TaxID=3029400 RepID=UPI00237EF580|nr:DUF4276 family protein [Nocardiopsis sp. N85]MDE3722746.1 DUF4276 family protein [Nocardiopsis sp. N85]
MRRLHILCEGQTEENLATETLRPYFTSPDAYVTVSVLNTRRTVAGPDRKGGVGRWSALDRDIRLLLRDTSVHVLTTLVDYYGAPSDTPGMGSRPQGAPRDRVAHVEAAMAEAVGDARFLPHLVLHETETWVLACADTLGELSGKPSLAASLRALSESAGGPESVNDGPDTAPSKRILRLDPTYRKTRDGPDAICLTGVEEIRRRCPHADAWFRAVQERLGTR